MFAYKLPQLATSDPVLLEFVSRMRSLRLKSLQTDAKSFISIYDSEVREPMEFWVKRYQSPIAEHFTIVRNPVTKGDNFISELLGQDWLGFMVLVGPNDTRAEPQVIQEQTSTLTGASPTRKEYFMAAVYIDPPIRGRGAGRLLVQAAIDSIRENQRRTPDIPISCVTSVVHGNNLALNLYQKLGFQIIDNDAIEEKEGRSYHTTALRIDL